MARTKTMDWLRRIAFWGALLLAVLLLDAHPNLNFESTSSLPENQTKLHTLSITLLASAPTQKTAPLSRGGSISVIAQVPGGYGAPHSVKLEKGKGRIQLPPGTYWVIARAQGYARQARRLHLSEDSTLRFTLEPAVRRTIEVVTRDNEKLQPFPEATVLLSQPGKLPHGLATDKQGRAIFDAVPSGELSVLVYASGYEPYEAVTTTDLLVRLKPVRTLRVHVTRNQEPAQLATVWISGLSLWPARAVQTGPQGYVEITGLRAGSYSVSAEQGDWVSEEARVKLRSEEGVEKLTLKLELGTFVLARVHEPSGEPIPEARVTHTQAGLGARTRHAQTDTYGMVRIGPLPELSGQLQVRARGFVPRVVDVALDIPQQIELSPAGAVSGRIVDSRGLPVSGARVEIVGTDVHGMPVAVNTRAAAVAEAHFDWALQSQNVLLPAGELGVLLGPVPAIPLAGVQPLGGEQLTTNRRGYFQVGDVPPGKLVVLARHPEHLDGRSKAFQLLPGGEQTVEVVLGHGEPLSGRVTDHRGFPVADARVHITGKGFDRRVAVQSDGTFSIDAAPETPRLRVSRSSKPFSVLLEHSVAAEERAEEIALTLPAPREDTTVKITDKSGDPVPLAQVTIISHKPSVPVRVTRFSNQEGTVHFQEVRGLPARIEASAPGFVSWRRQVELEAELRLALSPAVDVEGRVTAVRGRHPASGARVVFLGSAIERSTVADEFGNYQFPDLPPGPGKLLAEHPDYGKASKVVHVRSTERKARLPEIDLAAPLIVSGRVVDEKGRPLEGAILATDRISAYLPLNSHPPNLGISGENGSFEVEVPRTDSLYLFAMVPGESFGFSSRIPAKANNRVENVEVLLDRTDEAAPDARGTVLISLESPHSFLSVYAVAKGSSAYRAGLRRDDRLLRIDSAVPASVREARELLSGEPGSDVLLEFKRRGEVRTARVLREAFLR